MEDKFEKIYEELKEKNNQIFYVAKKERNKNIFMTIAICAVMIFLFRIIDKKGILFLISLILSLIVIIFVIINEFSKYADLFKKNIIEVLVKKCNSKLNFNIDTGVTKQDYKISKFDKSFDELFSEDMIYGKLEKNTDFRMSEILTKKIRKYRDEQGNLKEDKIVTFRGIYGIVRMSKSIDTTIYISNNDILQKYDSKRIEMDSAEFEQNYDCLADNKMTAIKIFTADLLEKFIDLKNGNLGPFLLKIENDKIYFRCNCGDIFEPPKIKDALDKNLIRKYYNAIVLPIEMVQKIIENINIL